MTLKDSFNSLVSDLREAKAAAESHNVASYEPPSSNPALSNAAGAPGSAIDKPPSSSSTNTTAQPSAQIVDPKPTAQQAYIPPPPPPKNLPHGWTARYDEGKGKFSYSHGLDNKNEQWDFPTEKTTEDPTERIA